MSSVESFTTRSGTKQLAGSFSAGTRTRNDTKHLNQYTANETPKARILLYA